MLQEATRPQPTTRGRPGAPLLVLLAALVAGCGVADEGADAVGYELWAMDQGTNRIHIFDADLHEIAAIDAEAHGARVPHMIDFTSDHAYAFVANPATGNVMVIRAADKEVVSVIPTGPRTHAVTVAPDDRTALVAVIGSPAEPWDGKLVELELDLANERFTVGRELIVAQDPVFEARRDEFRDSGVVCQDFTADGAVAYVSLGPELEAGGLVVVDTRELRLIDVFPPAEVPANCGTILSSDGRHMFVNGGGPDIGVWHVLDTHGHTRVHSADSRGHDAHGVWLTPDGAELWMVNRVTDNAIVIDPRTFDVLHEIDFVGTTPDIIAMSPDGRFAFLSLRGPNPVTMPHVAVGETPGVAVIDVRTRELVRLIEPAQGDDRSDFHGIAVRPL